MLVKKVNPAKPAIGVIRKFIQSMNGEKLTFNSSSFFLTVLFHHCVAILS